MSAADAIAGAQRLGEVELGASDRLERSEPERQIRGDCRRERASGAMRVVRFDALRRKLAKRASVVDQVDRFTRAMAPFDYDNARSQVAELARGLPGFLVRGDLDTRQRGRLMVIGSHYKRQRNEPALHRADRIRGEKIIAALGN